MRAALNATGRPIVYSVHSDVTEGTMDASLANYWRTGPDIGASYEQAIDRVMIDNNVSKYMPGGRGGWNDPDMLQVKQRRLHTRVTALQEAPPLPLPVRLVSLLVHL